MEVNQNIETFAECIENLISKDQVSKAIDALISWLRSDNADKEFLYEVLIISSNYRRLDRQLVQGLIELKEHRLERNHLLHQILHLLARVLEEKEEKRMTGTDSK